MVIKLIRDEFCVGNSYNEYSYRYMPFSYCCEELKECYPVELYIDGIDVNLAYRDVEVLSSWGDTFENEHFYPIKFCPFCGEQIEFEIIKVENVTELYNKLVAKRKGLHNELSVEDSKTRSKKISDMVCKFDDAINSLHEITEFVDYKEYEKLIKDIKKES